MNAPTYINTRLDIEKYNQYVLDLHKKKLKEIKSKSKKSFWAPKVKKQNKSLISNKIKDENRKLLTRLIEISQQKNSIRYSTPVLSTLNYAYRKKESERIDLENKRLFFKIQTVSGNVNQSYFEKEFNTYQGYKNLISRVNILKKRNSKSDRNLIREKTPKNTQSRVELSETNV